MPLPPQESCTPKVPSSTCPFPLLLWLREHPREDPQSSEPVSSRSTASLPAGASEAEDDIQGPSSPVHSPGRHEQAGLHVSGWFLADLSSPAALSPACLLEHKCATGADWGLCMEEAELEWALGLRQSLALPSWRLLLFFYYLLLEGCLILELAFLPMKSHYSDSTHLGANRRNKMKDQWCIIVILVYVTVYTADDCCLPKKCW